MKRKSLVIIISIMVIMLTLTLATACSSPAEGNNENQVGNVEDTSGAGNKGQIQIIKSELKFTQEQVESMIKAEYLVENGGYKPDDEIVMIVGLNEQSLLERYNEEGHRYYSTFAEYAHSEQGNRDREDIEEEQASALAFLQGERVVNEVVCSYSAVTNAIAIKTNYENLESIQDYACVSNVIMSETYNQPQATTDDSASASAIANLVEVYETGIFDSSSVEFDGTGTAVAVLDNGFDLSHSVFATQPQRVLISHGDVRDALANVDLEATKFTEDLEVNDVFYSDKIPFVYDYADKDPYVAPFKDEHGTHVAGIIGGKDSVITGVAINTQLVLMKVFPDFNDGGKTEDILLALNDAIILGVDAINMSLGSSCGFSREIDEENVNEIYDAIGEAGISLITAASNSYSSGFGGEQGNTNMVTNPDSGTVGSPSTYNSAMSVASISGVKSRYLYANGEQTIFFVESNAITGLPNDFYKELYEDLNLDPNIPHTFEYVKIPGVGFKVNYDSVGDLTGKIALVKRGDNTFEEKARLAKSAGAIACIIYNNIDGDINMSMGKTDHIPCISISKTDGTKLAEKQRGTITVDMSYQAGPFMSDFSSWGPTPSLELKPEITAHGGNIKSAVHGGGYDELSGTSMACPNLCGIVVLIRQYLKEKFATELDNGSMSIKDISNLCNSLLMSTATIIMNEEGNPYSPRKQGAGLGSLRNTVTTNAYLSVDGKDRPKLELGDDPERTGVYTMKFNVQNLSNKALSFELGLIGMTETVSESDEKHVAETPYILSGSFSAKGNGTALVGNKVTVEANGKTSVEIVYTLTAADKKYIEDRFPYGMYVEGFVTLKALEEGEVNLNMPFLAFYGDWTQAPMLDKTYYEVESTKHDGAIDEEDKIKADYFATTPYGSYFYNYIIPLGTYLYDMDTTAYEAIPASVERIAVSDILGCIDGINGIYTGLLRGAREMRYSITDKITGEVIYSYIDYNCQKAHSNGGSPYPYYDYLKIRSRDFGLINNRQYQFDMIAVSAYGDGGLTTNVRNSFSFDFVLDNEAPVIKEVSYEKVYDKTKKKDRYYMYLTVYDNQYAMSISPLVFTSSSTYDLLTKNPIPIYGGKGENTKVKIEITDYLEDIYYDELITSALGFSIDDYALNSNIYLCQLPGTKGEFTFTKNGETDGTDYVILSMYEDELVDLSWYLATKDITVDADKDYLGHLVWSSSNESVATIEKGILRGISEGRATITVYEAMDLNQAMIIVNVIKRGSDGNDEELRTEIESKPDDLTASESRIESIRFPYFETIFAYSRAAQTSEIGETGSKMFLNGINNAISFYPGEQIKLYHELNPWYAEDKYELTYETTNDKVASVDQDGVVKALKEGSATITLRVSGSTMMARLSVTVKNPFIIENRTLIAYKGLGGKVVIPDDEGLLYIGSFAFCLYETDNTIELPEDDFDANKIPAANTSITEVVVPEGVEEIQKYAFYNCSGLRKIVIGKDVKSIGDYCFYNDVKLTDIVLTDTKVDNIGNYAFYGCESLEEIDLSKVFAIGERAFEKCSSLKFADLTSLRNTGDTAFQNTVALESIVIGEHTTLSRAMFAISGLKEVVINVRNVNIPEYCFARCENLEKVTIKNDIYYIEFGAFCQTPKLTTVIIDGVVEKIETQAFFEATALERFVLPNSKTTIGEYAFYKCENLSTLEFRADTDLFTEVDGVVTSAISGGAFDDTALSNFVVDGNNPHYSTSADGKLLLNTAGDEIILAAVAAEYGDYTVDGAVKKIGAGAFSGTDVTSITFAGDVAIGDYAFVNAEELVTVNFAADSTFSVGKHAFRYATKLTTVNGLERLTSISDYAFADSGLREVVIADNAVIEEGGFYRSKLQKVTLGNNVVVKMGGFQACEHIEEVNLDGATKVTLETSAFSGCRSLATIDLSKVSGALGDEAFYGATSLKIADLSAVTEIGNYAFADCNNLVYLTLGTNLVRIGEGAFSRYEIGAPIFGGTDGTTTLTIPDSVTEIGDGAFIGAGIVNLVLSANLTEVSDYSFAYCEKLATVRLGNTATRIGNYSFAGCVLLYDINTANVKEIGDHAFNTANSKSENDLVLNLTAIETIGEGAFIGSYLKGNYICPDLTEVKMYAFQDTLITSFYAPALEIIGEGAFYGCTKMTEFILSENISDVGIFAFVGADSLKSFYYGTDKKTDGVVNDYAFLSDGIVYTVLESGKNQLTAVPAAKEIKTLVVLDGTVRVEAYAANANKNITEVVLPDSLRTIGNYAFYGCDELRKVEFKSVKAPILENSYIYDAQLTEGDPGYGLLHNQFDLFGYELCYLTFIDLAGKKEPIQLTVPANEDIVGYDSIVFEAFFGKLSDAVVNQGYIAMEQAMVDFLEYGAKVVDIDVVTIAHRDIIDKALTAYNSITQDPTVYGVDKTEFDGMVARVKEAKTEVMRATLVTASDKVKALQAKLDGLNTTFTVARLSELQALATEIKALKGEDRAMLIMDKYNELLASYEAYVAEVEKEMAPLKKSFDGLGVAAAVATSLAAVALSIIAKRRIL